MSSEKAGTIPQVVSCEWPQKYAATGCWGISSLNCSARYWITEMHVDGFRFDLASTLARELHEVDRLSAFF